MNDPVDFTDPSGLQAEVETAILTRSASERSQSIRLIGCGLALIASTVEVGFSIAAKLPKTSEIVTMIIGAVVGCALGALTSGPYRQAVLYPAVAGLIAATADLIAQWACVSATGHPEKFNPNQALAAGLAAISAGALGGAIGLAFPPEVTPILLSIEFAVISGEYVALLDKMTPEGASC